MSITVNQLTELLVSKEDEHLEFKEAKLQFDFDRLVKYCAAIANERGGKLILGVTDQRPRKVVGSRAFPDLERTKTRLLEELRIRVDAYTVLHPNGRVVVFDIPSRPVGSPIAHRGAYLMRSGESVVHMTGGQLKRIFNEATPDFSSQACPGATVENLDSEGIEQFRALWRRKSGNQVLNDLSHEQLLRDAELVTDDGVTHAALVLLGTRQALGKFLAQAEVVFEYRSSEVSGPAQQREEYRKGFFLFYDALWDLMNLRNDMQHYQEGLFVYNISTFDEIVVREAILNAVSHRDYRLAGSVFVRQFPRRLEIVNPGGLPEGITTENILFRQNPRNRRIAEVLSKCGLVERSGQGMNRMFEESIRQGKAQPDFTGTDDFQVSLTLRGEVQDPKFLQYLERVGKETLASFTTEDLLVLDSIHSQRPIPGDLQGRVNSLLDHGVIERVGRGRGVRYILSRRFYRFLGKRGTYTRKRGLDRETNRQLLLKHIKDNARDGSRLRDLLEVLPVLSVAQVQSLLREMKKERLVHNVGRTRAARWYPGSEPHNASREE
jgi:ATP-dependent DNA helicase RecG